MTKKGTLEIKPRQQSQLLDPRFGFRNLLALVFHDARNRHLVPLAEALLIHIKTQGLSASDWNQYLDAHPSVTYSNYQSTLRKLRSVGMLRKSKGVYRLSHDFTTFLNTASGCWTRFLAA